MRYLLMALFLVGCNSETHTIDEVDTIDAVKEVKFTSVDINEKVLKDFMGGTTERNNNNWYFESHTNQECINVLKGVCRKADIVADEPLSTPGRIAKYSYTLNIVEYPLDDSPEFVIVFQDWVRLIDGLSNHPTTTLKLVNINGLNLCGYNNSWQFDWSGDDWGHVSDGSIHDHPEEELNGCVKIDVGVNYNVEFFIYDAGQVKLLVNDVVIFDKEYQTKSPDREHVFSWGLYWAKGYNLSFDPLKRIITTMDGFTRFEN